MHNHWEQRVHCFDYRINLAYTTVGYARPISLLAFTTVGYASSEIDLTYTTIGYTRLRLISLLAYRTVGNASSAIHLAYPTVGYTSSETDLVYTAIGNIGFSALGAARVVGYASSVYTQLLGKLALI